MSPKSIERKLADWPNRVLSKVIKAEGDACWGWSAGHFPTGYGKISSPFDPQAHLPAHRMVYELLIGPVADDLVIDHLCRNRGCVNPAHMEPVTERENILRGEAPSAVNARKTHCLNGHEFSPENIYPSKDGSRKCRICSRARAARRYAERKAAA